MGDSDVKQLLQALRLEDFSYVDQSSSRRDRGALRKWSFLDEVARGLVRRSPRTPPEKRPLRHPNRFSLAFLSSCGGTGQSSLIATLARALFAEGRKAVAIDLDPSNGLSYAAGKPLDRPWFGVAHGTSAMGSVLSTLLAEGEQGPAFIPFGKLSGASLEAAEEAMRSGGESLSGWLDFFAQEEWEFVLYDLAVAPSPWSVQALREVDLVIGVVPPTPLGLAGIVDLERRVAESDEKLPIHYLLSRHDPRSALGRDVASILRLVRGEEILPLLIHEDPAVPEALARSSQLYVEAPDSQVVADLAALAKWILAKRGEVSGGSSTVRRVG